MPINNNRSTQAQGQIFQKMIYEQSEVVHRPNTKKQYKDNFKDDNIPDSGNLSTEMLYAFRR